MATLKALMTELSRKGLQEQRGEIIYHYTKGRTQSARELKPAEITGLYLSLRKDKMATEHRLDKKRKRLLAAIFGVFKMTNKQPTIDYVKGMACRAAKVDDFNNIPPARLTSLYNAFRNAQRDYSFARRLIANIEVELAEVN